MAKLKTDGLDAELRRLSEMGSMRTVDAACKYAIFPAAGLIADEIRRETPEDTGDLARSIIITPMEKDAGSISATITFAGYDSKGAPNIVKARVLESGRSIDHVGKHPFIRKARERIKKRALALMETSFNKYVYDKFGK